MSVIELDIVDEDVNVFESAGLDKYMDTEDALFHYTRTSTALEHILFSKRLRLSLLKDTNDPSEYKFKLFNMSGWSLPDNAPGLSKDALPVIDRILRSECKVMCFSSNKRPELILKEGTSVEDQYSCSAGWSKSRMWSQYGENHFGMCLVISRTALESTLRGIQAARIDFRCRFVRYAQDWIDWHAMTLDGNRLVNEGIDAYCEKHVVENAKGLFFTKHIDYRDEAEYRAVVFDPLHQIDYVDISSCIKGVVAGDRTSQVYYPLVRQMCAELKVEARRVSWSRGKPYLLACEPFPTISI
jgi:hypothetical protein